MMNLVSSLIGWSKVFGIEIIDHFDSFSGDLFLFDVGVTHRGLNVCVSQNLLNFIKI